MDGSDFGCGDESFAGAAVFASKTDAAQLTPAIFDPPFR